MNTATTFGDLRVKSLWINGEPVEPQKGRVPDLFPKSEAKTIKEMVEDFNALLGALSDAGVLVVTPVDA